MSGKSFVDFFVIQIYRYTDIQTECNFIVIDVVKSLKLQATNHSAPKAYYDQ